MKITRFEELKAWQRSRDLFRLIHEMTSRAPLCKNYPLRDQMTRASLSVMSNIAEGFDRGGDREFVQYLYLAKGSCAELRSQLYAALDAGYLDRVAFETAFHLSEETSRILQGLIRSIKTRLLKGRKFQEES